MKLEFKVTTLITLFSYVGLLFFTGFISFLYHMATGGSGADLANDTEGSPINKIVGLSLLLVCFYYSVRYQLIINKTYLYQNFWLIFFVLYIFFSCLWSVDPGTSIRRAIFLLSVVFFAGYLTRLYTIETVFSCIGYLIALYAILGLLRAVVDPSNTFLSGGLRDGAFLGIFSDKNGGARTYVFGIMFLLPNVFKKNKLALVAALFCLICLAISHSASGLIMLAIGGGTYLFFNQLVASNYILNIKKYFLGGIVYISACALLYQSYQFILNLVGRDADLTDRSQIWAILTPLVEQKLMLGYGFGAFWGSSGGAEFIDRWKYIGNAHNGYIETLLHGGLPLLVILLLSLIFAIKKSIINASANYHAPYQNISIAILIQLLVINFVAYSIPNHISTDFFVFMLVLFYANQAPRREE